MNDSAVSPTAPSISSNARWLTVEAVLLGLALALGLFLRMINLGAAPLNDSEASWALQALRISGTQQSTISVAPGALPLAPQPAYIFLTAALFSLFGASNFLARFWPALAGAFLVAIPLLYRRKLSPKVALVLTFGLALDPGLVTISRQAGGPMLALAFTLLAVGLWYARKPVLAGILAGLALLSGSALVSGVIGLVAAWGLTRLLRRSSNDNQPQTGWGTQIKQDTRLRPALVAAAASFLLVGTDFLRNPQGLGAAVQAFAAWLSGWVQPSGVSPLTLLAALLVFEALALFFFIVSVARWIGHLGLHTKTDFGPQILAGCWLLISLLLALIYPGRQVNNLAWSLVPLWVLAAFGLAAYLPEKRPHPISFLEAGMILVQAALFWNTLIATNQIPTSSAVPVSTLRFAILIGILLLAGLTTALFALGWSWQVSRDGLAWGVAICLLIYSISVMWGASQLRTNQPEELWGIQPASGQADLFTKTVRDLSNWNTGLPNYIDILSTVDVPSLRWLLRNYPAARFVSELPPAEKPAIVITNRDQQPPNLTAAYRGQDFVWWAQPGWTGAVPEDLLNWITYRQAQPTYSYIILWARTDLFPGTEK
jgi:hypothetical protein